MYSAISARSKASSPSEGRRDAPSVSRVTAPASSDATRTAISRTEASAASRAARSSGACLSPSARPAASPAVQVFIVFATRLSDPRAPVSRAGRGLTCRGCCARWRRHPGRSELRTPQGKGGGVQGHVLPSETVHGAHLVAWVAGTGQWQLELGLIQTHMTQ